MISISVEGMTIEIDDKKQNKSTEGFFTDLLKKSSLDVKITANNFNNVPEFLNSDLNKEAIAAFKERLQKKAKYRIANSNDIKTLEKDKLRSNLGGIFALGMTVEEIDGVTYMYSAPGILTDALGNSYRGSGIAVKCVDIKHNKLLDLHYYNIHVR